jgi:DNA-binding HxlR family transcriptional regulator
MCHSIKPGTNGEKSVAQYSVAEYNAELLTLARKRAALGCGVQTALSVIEGHWKLPILFRLLGGTRRFGELRKHLPAATQRMLTLHLRELERDGLIHREVYREVPPKVEYSMTELGRSLEPLLRFMSEWGHANRASMVAGIESLARARVDEAPTIDRVSTTPVASAVHLR